MKNKIKSVHDRQIWGALREVTRCGNKLSEMLNVSAVKCDRALDCFTFWYLKIWPYFCFIIGYYQRDLQHRRAQRAAHSRIDRRIERVSQLCQSENARRDKHTFLQVKRRCGCCRIKRPEMKHSPPHRCGRAEHMESNVCLDSCRSHVSSHAVVKYSTKRC